MDVLLEQNAVLAKTNARSARDALRMVLSSNPILLPPMSMSRQRVLNALGDLHVSLKEYGKTPSLRFHCMTSALFSTDIPYNETSFAPPFLLSVSFVVRSITCRKSSSSIGAYPTAQALPSRHTSRRITS